MKFEEALAHYRNGYKIELPISSIILNPFFRHVESERRLAIDDIFNEGWEICDKPEKYYQDGIELPTRDSQPNIETRLAELEQWTRAEEDRVNDVLKLINQRLLTLDNFIGQNYKSDMENLYERTSKLEFRLKEAERFQDITHEQYISIARKEKPHACPSCDGSGAIPMHHEPKAILDRMQAKRDERGMPYRDCKSCQGKGVLWK